MYYDGSNWKWDNWEDDASEFWERYREAVKDYGNKLNHKGDEMGKKLIDEIFAKQILSDLDKIRETLCDIQGSGKGEKKEPRKLWEIIRCAHPVPDQGGHNQIYQHMASVSIDAVIECYHQWRIDNGSMMGNKPFPEYLKEKML